jgi:decaprenyl-phosphate phosphoribosyltransferase
MFSKNSYIKLIRPTHWLKNVIIGLPLVLSMQINTNSLINLLLGIISFSLLASGGYILNDIKDIENDRQHHKKRNRPLANGTVDVANAFLLALIFIISAFLTSIAISKEALYFSIFYFCLNYFYSIIGKQIRFFDIIILSSFYIIRVFYGATINNVPLTGWFVATLTLSVLSLSIHKRYMECKNSEQELIPGRGYNKSHEQFLQILMINFGVAAIILLNIHAFFVLNIITPIFYVLLNLTSAGIMLLYFDESTDKSDDPVSRIIKNKKLLIALIVFLIIYIFEIISKSK